MHRRVKFGEVRQNVWFWSYVFDELYHPDVHNVLWIQPVSKWLGGRGY